MEKEDYCYVTYNEASASSWSVGLMPYSEKSFVFSINFVPGKSRYKLANKAALAFLEMEGFFTKDPSNPLSLGGTLNERLTNSDGDRFMGFVFSIAFGQRALEWFAQRSALLPNASEVELPEEIDEADEETKEDYLRKNSSHTFEELCGLIGVKPRKTAAKSQASPKLVKDAPTRSSLPEKKREIKGLPASRAAREPDETQAPAPAELQAAINTIFRAIRLGAFETETLFESNYTETEEKESKVYVGYAGARDKVRDVVKKLVKKHSEDELLEYEPALTLRLFSHTDKNS